MLFISCFHAEEKRIIEVSDSKFQLKNGVLLYDNKPFTGITISHYTPTVGPKSEIQYISGRKQGYEKQWYPSGQLAIERYYNLGKKVRIHSAWWENGTAKFEYHFNTKGEYHGIVKEWYSDGQLLRYFNYVNGQESGSQRLWKADGSIKANYEVWNGERYGLIGLKKCFTVETNSIEIK